MLLIPRITTSRRSSTGKKRFSRVLFAPNFRERAPHLRQSRLRARSFIWHKNPSTKIAFYFQLRANRGLAFLFGTKFPPLSVFLLISPINPIRPIQKKVAEFCDLFVVISQDFIVYPLPCRASRKSLRWCLCRRWRCACPALRSSLQQWRSARCRCGCGCG